MKQHSLRYGLLVATIVAIMPSNGMAWSTQGGETLDTRENAAEVSTGYPYAIRMGYHLPVLRNFEFIPAFGFYYGIATEVPQVGVTFLPTFKYRLFQSGKVHLSFVGEPGFLLRFHPEPVLFGISFGVPQFLGTYNVNNTFSLHFGMKMPISLFFGRQEVSTTVMIPILVSTGVEFTLSPQVTFFSRIDLGVTIFAASEGSESRFSPVFLMGVAFRF